MKKLFCILALLLMVIMVYAPAMAIDDPVATEAAVDGVPVLASVTTVASNSTLTIVYTLIFVACFAVLLLLGLRGKLNAAGMDIVKTVTGAITTLTTSIAAVTPNKTDDIMATIMQLVEKAVYAAENMYYNDHITANERYDTCMEYFNQMLNTAGIKLTDAWYSTIDVLIKAACESMGHNVIMINHEKINEEIHGVDPAQQ